MNIALNKRHIDRYTDKGFIETINRFSGIGTFGAKFIDLNYNENPSKHFWVGLHFLDLFMYTVRMRLMDEFVVAISTFLVSEFECHYLR